MDDQGPGGPGKPGPEHPERPVGRPERSGRPSARAGRRGNGLPADAFSALTEIDPRLAGTVLETLAEAGIAAWVRPFGGTRGGYLEVRVPARPLDCLYVDATRRGDALSVLAEQVPDLLGLRSGDAAGAAAGRPANAEAGSQTSSAHAPRDAADAGADPAGADPASAGPANPDPADPDPGSGDQAEADSRGIDQAEADSGRAESGADRAGSGPNLDIEAAFALIVAGYAREAHNPFDLPPGSLRERSADGEVGKRGGPVARDGPTPPPGPAKRSPTEPGGAAEHGGPAAATGEGPSENGSAPVKDRPDGSLPRGPSRPAGAPPAVPNTWFVSGSGQLSSGFPGADPRDDSNSLLDDHHDHDDHYEPPPAPPTPPPSRPTRWALVAIGLGLLLLIAPTLVALHASDLVHVAGVLMICTGVGILVARMRHEDEDDDPDDGAVV